MTASPGLSGRRPPLVAALPAGQAGHDAERLDALRGPRPTLLEHRARRTQRLRRRSGLAALWEHRRHLAAARGFDLPLGLRSDRFVQDGERFGDVLDEAVPVALVLGVLGEEGMERCHGTDQSSRPPSRPPGVPPIPTHPSRKPAEPLQLQGFRAVGLGRFELPTS